VLGRANPEAIVRTVERDDHPARPEELVELLKA